MRISIYPYKFASVSASNLRMALAEEFPAATVNKVRSRNNLINDPQRVVINWGNAHSPDIPILGTILNSPEAINNAGNKVRSFNIFAENDIPTPPFTTDIVSASRWLINGRNSVVARTVLRGHSGEGIVIVEPGEALPPAPLYVLYKKKRHEFRVHVFRGDVIDIQQKKKERGAEDVENRAKIRNRANGWVFCRENLDLSEGHHQRISGLAISAVESLGLDFGAADIIYNHREDCFYVLEVNTAPGLEGTTLEVYKNAFSNYIRNNNA